MVEIDGDTITIYDEYGIEVVRWIEDEWAEDPDVVYSIANAIRLHYEKQLPVHKNRSWIRPHLVLDWTLDSVLTMEGEGGRKDTSLLFVSTYRGIAVEKEVWKSERGEDITAMTTYSLVHDDEEGKLYSSEVEMIADIDRMPELDRRRLAEQKQ